VLIATGARPRHPAGIPFEHRDVLDSQTAQRIERRVRSVVVIGGGAVACEYASIFAALGTQVTLVESRGQLLGFMDAEIAGLLAQTFTDMGIEVLLGAGHADVAVDADGVVVTLPDGTVMYPAKVVGAAGRTGNTEGLGLEQAGVATDAHGHVLVDETYATTAPGVFAAGDVIGPPGLASVSMEQGRVAVCHAFGISLRDAVDHQAVLGVYSIPEVAMVGATEEVARSAGEDVIVGRARLSRNARTAISAGAPGMVKLVFGRDDRRLLGAHVIGDHATELIHLAQAVLHFGGTADYFVSATLNSPTAGEAFKFAAYDALSRAENRPTLTANV
jgi:NAD(P) transhydrogenase